MFSRKTYNPKQSSTTNKRKMTKVAGNGGSLEFSWAETQDYMTFVTDLFS